MVWLVKTGFLSETCNRPPPLQGHGVRNYSEKSSDLLSDLAFTVFALIRSILSCWLKATEISLNSESTNCKMVIKRFASESFQQHCADMPATLQG